MKPLLTLAFLLLLSAPAFSQVRLTGNELILENDLVRKTLRFSAGRPAAVRPSLFLKSANREMLSPAGGVGWFEFVVDGQLASANDPYWRYQTHRVRKMVHGGQEVELSLLGSVAPVKGLEVVITQQMFPGSTVIREKITLRTRGRSAFPLTAHQSQLHFVFPRYSINVSVPTSLISEEIRIASWGQELVEGAKTAGYDERTEPGNSGDRNLAQNYMYHPRRIEFAPNESGATSHKGPVLITVDQPGETGWLIAYEHGSPDDDPEQDYLFIGQNRKGAALEVAVNVAKGAYFDGERITATHSFGSVWSAFGVFQGNRLATGEALLYDYLFRWICEVPDSRKPAYYYNTWGMQRASPLPPGETEPRSILTTAKVREEIALAGDLGIKLFVLDDGWQNEFGNWTAHHQRFENGLKPVFEALDRRGITFGIWLAPLYVDESAPVYRAHADLAVVDDQGKPVTGRWEKKAFCLVSDYHAQFEQMCKNLVEQGVRYFKWDGLDKHLCSSPRHDHGDDRQTPQQRKERYGYAFPLRVTQALAELKAYQPGVVVEMDVTEPHRSVGLSFLSEGKYFWMNNGASAYGDYSTFRSKSIRTIPGLFHRFMPPVLQTYAAYPHNQPPHLAQRYNVNSAMVGGKGFWGNLNLMTKAQRLKVGEHVRKFQETDSLLTGIPTQVTGSVGGSPEIYARVDRNQAAGQVVAFSGSALDYVHRVPLNGKSLLAVVHNAYRVENDTLRIFFRFPMGEVSREAFVFPNRNSGICLVSSTSWLKDVRLKDNQLTFSVGAPGEHVLQWPLSAGKPKIEASSPINVEVEEDPANKWYVVRIQTLEAATEVTAR